MCRLFAQISTEKASALDFLVEKEFSILRQSQANPKGLQKDGWGLGFRPPNGPWTTFKSDKPVFQESDTFRAVSRASQSPFILAHIRHASNPRKLPAGKLIHVENCQPYSHENLIFAHNGTLNIPDEVAATLGDWRSKIRGVNDSEVLFWLFVKTWNEIPAKIRSPERWKQVFKAMVRRISAVWDRIPKKDRKHALPYRGLNFIASDQKTLAALCFYDQAEGKSLCGQDRPYFEMCYQDLQDRTAVASEPLDRSEGWNPIPAKHVLVIEPKKNRLAPTLLDLKIK